MNEELQQKVFSWITEVTAKIGDWTCQQLPPFVNEYLQWKFFENLMYCGISIAGLLLLLIGSIVFYKIARWAYEKSDDGCEDVCVMATVANGILGVVCGLALFGFLVQGNYIDHGMEAAKIKMAPKVYLMEQASKFIKQ